VSARMAGAHVSDGTGFATKPALAVQMIKRAIAAGLPFAWVAADSIYRVGDVEQSLRRDGTIGPIANWPTSTPPNTIRRILASGPEVC
jgi:hypothetical protein